MTTTSKAASKNQKLSMRRGGNEVGTSRASLPTGSTVVCCDQQVSITDGKYMHLS